ncbi:MAG: GDSL-type esterase/lipase family protein [Cytophagales bacterium]|nr:GDSL-type esterase/lipase family protein [Cytophagales bacterium]
MFWYHDEVNRLRAKSVSDSAKKKVVFYGSSSIRLWDTLESDFELICQSVNAGFGGSTLAACAWFFDELIPVFAPDALMIYAGDNDLGDGRHPEEIHNHFLALIYKIRLRYPHMPVTYISIKPSPARWYINDRIHYTNKIIADSTAVMDNTYYLDIYSQMLDAKSLPLKEYYLPDGLHLSKKGYKVWKKTIGEHLQSMV